jgi:hypothetical protein
MIASITNTSPLTRWITLMSTDKNKIHRGGAETRRRNERVCSSPEFGSYLARASGRPRTAVLLDARIRLMSTDKNKIHRGDAETRRMIERACPL